MVISAVLGAHNRLNTTTNQTAMYAQAPADSTRPAAGMLRTFTYPGRDRLGQLAMRPSMRPGGA
jgi:hypothetical protein